MSVERFHSVSWHSRRTSSKARWKARVLGEVGVDGGRGTEEVEREGRTSGDDEVVGIREVSGTRLLGF